MRLELEIAGHDVQFVAINKSDAIPNQQKLVDKCSFPLLQDLKTIGVWDLMKGKKDDFYIYAKDGTLAKYLPISGETSVNLSTDEGYENLKQAILDVVAP